MKGGFTMVNGGFMMLISRPILLVEDDCVDVMAVKRVLKDLHIANELVYAENGEEAVAYLRDKGDETPCVILLDLNMPKMNGLEFLQIIKADARLKSIPVVVVSTSSGAEDMARSFELGAALYILKCSDYGVFRENMAAIRSYLAAGRPAAAMESARP
jgi:CheY-like chemotaxis protein